MLWLFWILLVMYGIAAFKVTGWQTISRLGFKSETPELYLLKPYLYHWFCYFLFIITILIPIISDDVPWWGVIFALIEAFFIAVKGREKAIKNYRIILQELLSESNDEKNKNFLKKELEYSDLEIWNNLKRKKNF